MEVSPRLRLNDGVEIPRLGLGVYQIPEGKATEQAVGYALECGYRLIDTASLYGNEGGVGKAVRQSKIPREEVFVTTKLWNTDHGYEATLAACEKSLRRLGLPYVDLYLIHWPFPGLRMDSWRAMERLQKEGKCRSIGVSNYMVSHLEEHFAEATVPPSVNQVEFSPFLYQKDLLAYCQKRKVSFEAYSPLTKGHRLGDPTIQSMARQLGRTPAQILLRWGLQHGCIVIPKSSRK